MAMGSELRGRQRVGLFLLAWMTVWAVWIAFMASGGDWTLRTLLLAGLPMTSFYAAACLNAGRLCRIFPLRPVRLWSSVINQAAAAMTLAFVWILMGHGLSFLIPGLRLHNGLLFIIGILLYLTAAAGFYAAHAVQDAWQAQRASDQAQLLAREAELRALRAQINPHFLFNSLHSISALASLDPPRARQMCLHLAEMFRLSLQLGRQDETVLAEELKLLRAYLAVEQVRFGSRLHFRDEVDGCSPQAMLPSLILQPLVENAVKHGIAGLTGCGEILLRIDTRIDTRVDTRGDGRSEVLRIVLENDYDPDSLSPNRNGVGLVNLQQRLATRYGHRAVLSWHGDRGRFSVRLQIPFEPAKASDPSGASA